EEIENLIRQRGEENFKLIKNKKNLGFAAGNNIGIKASSGKYILLLNSDTIVFPDTLVSMYRYMDTHPEVGVATCRVEFPDGQLDPACHRGFPTPWASLTYFLGLERLFPKSKIFGRYHLGFLPMDKLHEIDSPTGAFYLVRQEIIDKVGFLDEDYFMYGEDLDWSYRIRQAGWKIMYYPYVKIIHLKKQSGRVGENPEVRKQATCHFYETMKIFYKKHYKAEYPGVVTVLILLAIEVKKRLDLLQHYIVL
ncbi:glycosyltransferase, partial [Candidatus Gottesmanbacteria bacterium]|nr:glycosyltransferase [Candidatus Gottesmanbacteria bacterium]